MNLVELGGILVLKLKCSDNLIWLVVLTPLKKYEFGSWECDSQYEIQMFQSTNQ
jgi:hypothetical protein